MRSGDGNRSFLLTVCTLIFLLSPVLFAGEYFISYRYVVKDAMLFNEQLLVSPAMQPCKGIPNETLLLDNPNDATLKEIIQHNRERFITYLHHLGLQVQYRETTTNMQNSSTTVMTLPTTCFKVDFNDNSVTITPLK